MRRSADGKPIRCCERSAVSDHLGKALIYYFSVIPVQAGIQSLAEPSELDSGSPLRFGRNDESIRDSLVSSLT
jgi:hypothetical protein